jgi:uncharacterized coiled-coil protein SlyX
MRPQRAMVGLVVPAPMAPSRPPLAVLEARAAEQARARVLELEDKVAEQAAEIAALRAQLTKSNAIDATTQQEPPAEAAPARVAQPPRKKRRKRT